MKGMDKRGQELSVGTLILIVLGIVLLVLLILGFSLGWSNLWEKINIFGSSTSLESLAQKCTLAVTSSSLVSYCETFSLVTVDGKKQYLNCEYEKLSLDKKLSCSSSSNRVANKCIELLKDTFAGKFTLSEEKKFTDECLKVKDLTVNDEPCSSFCTQVKFGDVNFRKKESP